MCSSFHWYNDLLPVGLKVTGNSKKIVKKAWFFGDVRGKAKIVKMFLTKMVNFTIPNNHTRNFDLLLSY